MHPGKSGKMQYKEKFEKTYQGKKVLLTGHTGFKGSWMLCWLQQLGAIVKGYALKPEQDNGLYCLINGDSLCDSIIADIRDAKRVKDEILSFQPDFIFHFAAQPLVRLSYEQPAETFDINVMGTLHILDALRALQKPCTAVLITTDKVYDNKEADYHYKETDPLGGYDPYSASKACAELVIQSYRNSFFNPNDHALHQKAIGSARAGNVIGGGDRAKDRIIPDIIRSLEKNEPVAVRNPNAVRPWQHVLEPLSGYLLLGAKLQQEPQLYSSAWNFGPQNDDTLTVKEVVEQSLSYWKSGAYNTPQLAKQPHEAGLLKLDISKAITKLDWQPKWDTAIAIRKTLEWYKNVSAKNAAAYTASQINEYQDL